MDFWEPMSSSINALNFYADQPQGIAHVGIFKQFHYDYVTIAPL